MGSGGGNANHPPGSGFKAYSCGVPPRKAQANGLVTAGSGKPEKIRAGNGGCGRVGQRVEVQRGDRKHVRVEDGLNATLAIIDEREGGHGAGLYRKHFTQGIGGSEGQSSARADQIAQGSQVHRDIFERHCEEEVAFLVLEEQVLRVSTDDGSPIALCFLDGEYRGVVDRVAGNSQPVEGCDKFRL